jgi:hypothetical protein
MRLHTLQRSCKLLTLKIPGDSSLSLSTRFFTAVAILAASAIPACADTFTYDFSDTLFSTSFTYTSPVLISTLTTVVPTMCSIGDSACTTVEFDPADLYLQINSVPGGEHNYSAYSGFDLFNVGVHDYGRITMIVIDNPAAVTPEPSTFVLLGTGLLGAIGACRRRFFQA